LLESTDLIEERFRRFRDQASAFSKEISSAVHYDRIDPAESAKINLKISRVIFSKWSLEILVLLYTLRVLGFEALRKNLRGISSRVLSAKLKKLEEEGLVKREVQQARPVRVFYVLTDLGLTTAKIGEPVFLYLRYEKKLEGTSPSPKAEPVSRLR